MLRRWAVTGAGGCRFKVWRCCGGCNLKTREFVNIFTSRYGSVVCRDILACDIFTDAGREVVLRENLFATRCLDVVVHAAQILSDLGC
jgi:hypothetical protein